MKILIVIRKFIVNIITFYFYIDLLILYFLYFLLAIDYHKLPDDNILITESKYDDYLNIYDNFSGWLSNYILYAFILLVILKVLKINWISKKQIIIFLLSIAFLFFLMIIDPFNLFNWILD